MDSTTNLINPDARMGLTGAQPGAGLGAAGTGGAGYAGGADFSGGGNGFGPRMPMLNQFRNNPRMPLIIAVAHPGRGGGGTGDVVASAGLPGVVQQSLGPRRRCDRRGAPARQYSLQDRRIGRRDPGSQ